MIFQLTGKQFTTGNGALFHWALIYPQGKDYKHVVYCVVSDRVAAQSKQKQAEKAGLKLTIVPVLLHEIIPEK